MKHVPENVYCMWANCFYFEHNKNTSIQSQLSQSNFLVTAVVPQFRHPGHHGCQVKDLWKLLTLQLQQLPLICV